MSFIGSPFVQSHLKKYIIKKKRAFTKTLIWTSKMIFMICSQRRGENNIMHTERKQKTEQIWTKPTHNNLQRNKTWHLSPIAGVLRHHRDWMGWCFFLCYWFGRPWGAEAASLVPLIFDTFIVGNTGESIERIGFVRNATMTTVSNGMFDSASVPNFAYGHNVISTMLVNK